MQYHKENRRLGGERSEIRRKRRGWKISQQEECSPCKHKVLSLIPGAHVKKARPDDSHSNPSTGEADSWDLLASQP